MTDSSIRSHSHSPYLLVLAVVCMPGAARSQAAPPPPASPLIILDSKAASRLGQDQASPEYPPIARINYIQGHVAVQIRVGRNGKVAWTHVLRGNPLLAVSALKAIRGWIYHPLITPSGPAAFLTTVQVRFALRTDKLNRIPTDAERDLSRQVKPPEVIGRPVDPPPTSVVHMRLLLDDQGQVIDSESPPIAASHLDRARKALRSWTFRPAHWGNLPIPWYLEVDVPISEPAAERAAADPDLR
jgi:TonB family protein